MNEEEIKYHAYNAGFTDGREYGKREVAASLADDETLVDAVAGGMFAAQAVTDLDDIARIALRTLAAALENR